MQEPSTRQPTYHGATRTLLQIALSNGFFTIITLGFFRFWGKTRVRRYLWSRISFLGDRIHYTGHGRELFVGFLIALVFLVPLGLAIQYGTMLLADPLHQALFGLFYFIGFLCLYQIAVFRSRRYRLSRTTWRHIHFGQDGSAVRYAVMASTWFFLSILTLGLLYGPARLRLQAFRTRHSFFGDRRMEFDGRGRELFASWFMAWLFCLPTLGISYFLYRIKEFRYVVARTRIGGLSFECTLGIGRVIRVSTLISILAVGIVILVLLLAGLVIAPELIALSDAEFDSQDLFEIAFDAALAKHAALLVVIVLAGFMLFGALKLVFWIQPLLGAIVDTTSVRGGDEIIEAIGQSERAGLSGGEGFADAFDIGSV